MKFRLCLSDWTGGKLSFTQIGLSLIKPAVPASQVQSDLCCYAEQKTHGRFTRREYQYDAEMPNDVSLRRLFDKFLRCIVSRSLPPITAT